MKIETESLDITCKRGSDEVVHVHSKIPGSRKSEGKHVDCFPCVAFQPVICEINKIPSLNLLVLLSFVVFYKEILLEIDPGSPTPDMSKPGGENAGSCCFFEGQEAEDVAEQLARETGDDVSAAAASVVVAVGSHCFNLCV